MSNDFFNRYRDIFIKHFFSELQEDGLAAWDCVYQEEVLAIPWGLAALGDNPMQSELSSHIGLNGRFFCRVCNVDGKKKKDDKYSRVKAFVKVSIDFLWSIKC